MTKQYKKLIILIIIIIAIPYPIWYAINYYAAGLTDQTALIEFGMEDDFIYCNKWRPELLDPNKKIIGYKSFTNKFDLEYLLAELERTSNDKKKSLVLITPIDNINHPHTPSSDVKHSSIPSFDIKCWIKIYQLKQIMRVISPCTDEDHVDVSLIFPNSDNIYEWDE